MLKLRGRDVLGVPGECRPYDSNNRSLRWTELGPMGFCTFGNRHKFRYCSFPARCLTCGSRCRKSEGVPGNSAMAVPGFGPGRSDGRTGIRNGHSNFRAHLFTLGLNAHIRCLGDHCGTMIPDSKSDAARAGASAPDPGAAAGRGWKAQPRPRSHQRPRSTRPPA